MFVQIMQAKIGDADLLGRQLDAWRRDIKPGAKGYLGSTSGITPDGRSIAIVRFDSQQAAEANSTRPEQGAWWAETEKAFDGPVSFENCTEVDTPLGGGASDAGFVQVIQGRVKDQDSFRKMVSEHETELRAARPDILGMLVAWHGDGGFTQAVYFKDEAGTRQLEQATEGGDMRKELMDQFAGPPTFFDLPNPDLD
ncbi:MAG: hypothetical protein JWO37_2524 [Acidimicrobiales bacterium]|jgi:hypothetical protein|nr:hypothetical protein [Acidimicrobiales bacterium]